MSSSIDWHSTGPAPIRPAICSSADIESDVADPRLDGSMAHAVTVRPDADRVASWWASHLVRLANAGATAFRLLGLGLLPAGALREIVAATRRETDCAFWAWTPGLAWSRHGDLAGAGLDGVFASTAWWDGSAAWYVEEHDSLSRIAPVIGVVAEARSLPADAAAPTSCTAAGRCHRPTACSCRQDSPPTSKARSDKRLADLHRRRPVDEGGSPADGMRRRR